MIEVFIPEDRVTDLQETIKNIPTLGIWQGECVGDIVSVRILVNADNSGEALDLIQNRYSKLENFRLILYPVETSLPRPEEEEEKKADEPHPRETLPKPRLSRISRDELYDDLYEVAGLRWIFIIMVVLSTIVAAIGLLKGNVAIVIGAMVIAPLLGPNVAFSLATTLADSKLAKKAVTANLAGFTIAFTIAVIVGIFVTVDPSSPEIAFRVEIGLSDIALALAAGAAGTLAFTTGAPTALIGVMVAVALLPPLVALGLLVGSALWSAACGAFLLFLTNVVCVNFAGVCTFLLQDIRPATWWEKSKARKATWKAIIFWVILLAVIIVLILLSQHARQ
jgi:uncharacterized hydrophobic protein (TIGR00341 family)